MILISWKETLHIDWRLTYNTERLPCEAKSSLPSSVPATTTSRPDSNDVLKPKHHNHHKLLQRQRKTFEVYLCGIALVSSVVVKIITLLTNYVTATLHITAGITQWDKYRTLRTTALFNKETQMEVSLPVKYNLWVSYFLTQVENNLIIDPLVSSVLVIFCIFSATSNP